MEHIQWNGCNGSNQNRGHCIREHHIFWKQAINKQDYVYHKGI